MSNREATTPGNTRSESSGGENLLKELTRPLSAEELQQLLELLAQGARIKRPTNPQAGKTPAKRVESLPSEPLALDVYDWIEKNFDQFRSLTPRDYADLALQEFHNPPCTRSQLLRLFRAFATAYERKMLDCVSRRHVSPLTWSLSDGRDLDRTTIRLAYEDSAMVQSRLDRLTAIRNAEGPDAVELYCLSEFAGCSAQELTRYFQLPEEEVQRQITHRHFDIRESTPTVSNGDIDAVQSTKNVVEPVADPQHVAEEKPLVRSQSTEHPRLWWRRSTWRKVTGATALAVLLSFVLAGIWGSRLTPKPSLSKTTGSFEVTGLASKGSDDGNSGDPFRIFFDAQTSAFKGWLIQIDNEAAVLHGTASVTNGNIVLEHKDSFDTRDCYEYGVLLLANKDVSVLNSKSVNWLSANDLRQLQEVAPNDPDFSQATAVIQRALQAAGVSEVREIAVVRKRHHFNQRPLSVD